VIDPEENPHKSGKNIKNLDKGVQKLFDHFPPETSRGQL
jgi:hypothetical protein